jgi:hypothetical protein
MGPLGRIYELEETIRAAHRWTRERDAPAEPFLSGMFTHGEVIFAGLETEALMIASPSPSHAWSRRCTFGRREQSIISAGQRP